MTILKLFKLFILSHCLALSGSEFHDFEAARIKTAHRNALVFQVVGLIKDFIYLIVVFLLVRKAATCFLRCAAPDHNNSSLNFILCLIGNQCNSLRTGFMWSDFLLFVINRAAKFCTSCRRSSRNCGSPYGRVTAVALAGDKSMDQNFSVWFLQTVSYFRYTVEPL